MCNYAGNDHSAWLGSSYLFQKNFITFKARGEKKMKPQLWNFNDSTSSLFLGSALNHFVLSKVL